MNNYNPWLDILPEDYEMHMSDQNVFQMQMLNNIMKSQIEDYAPNNMVIFGVATGNGLEHTKKVKNVYAIDVNERYLKICKERFGLNKNIKFLNLDIQNDDYDFNQIEMAICNLILEYIDEDKWIKKVSEKIIENGIISLVFQVNESDDFISRTNNSDVFSILNKIHHNVNEDNILKIMEFNGLAEINKENYFLPNNKKLIRIDFKKKSSIAQHGVCAAFAKGLTWPRHERTGSAH